MCTPQLTVVFAYSCDVCICVCMWLIYLQVSGVCDHRDALQALGVAAARAALHLDTGRPQHKVSIAAVQHPPGDLNHLCTNFTQSLLGWLRI